MKGAVVRLLNSSCGVGYEGRVSERALRMEGVRGVDMVRSRRFGSASCVDLEITVDGTLPLRDAHEISERARSAAAEEKPCARNVAVHVNPI